MLRPLPIYARGLRELLPNQRETGLFDEYCQVVETGNPLVKEDLIDEDVFGEERLNRAFDICIAKLGYVSSTGSSSAARTMSLVSASIAIRIDSGRAARLAS